jgi:glycosyltransferase involved in cell wall biosynthesis
MLKAAIYNTYLSTFGGGEKSTYVSAAVLASLGFEVDILTFEQKVPSISDIEAFFGPGHGGFNIRSLPQPARDVSPDECLPSLLSDYALFVNHCAGSSAVNCAPLGLYFVMFPFQVRGSWLESYDHFLCNSRFTEFYTRRHWVDRDTHVLYPCADGHFGDLPAERRKDILVIGRFNWGGHTKNQDVLVKAFEGILGDLPPGWRLVLLGKLNDHDAHSKQKYAELRDYCRELPVVFEVNVSESRKREVLAGSSLYWHGTGLGYSEPQDAARMEHFGIAVVEALQAGVIPICYSHGGPAEIIEHGRSGFLFDNVEELANYTLALAADASLQARLRSAGRERATLFGREMHERRLADFIRKVVLR